MRIFCEHAQTQYLKLEEYTVIHINSKQMYYIEYSNAIYSKTITNKFNIHNKQNNNEHELETYI